MKKRRKLSIEVGDTVLVTYCDSETGLLMKVVGVPQDTGDMWKLVDEKTNKMIYLNPCSSCLHAISLTEKGAAHGQDED